MPLWLPTLIMIFAVILIIDAIGSFMMWKYTGNRLFFIASIGWAANFVNFTIHGMATGHDVFTLVGHSFFFITAVSLAVTLWEISEIKYNFLNHIKLGIAMLTLSILNFILTKSYFFSALIIDTCIAGILILSALQAINKFKNKNEPLLKIFAVIIIISGIHYLDYPFLFNNPNGNIFGFSFAFLVSIINSILLPLIILDMSSKKYTAELENIVSIRTSALKQKTEELEIANLDKNALLSIVCHDISTPITVMEYNLNKLGKSLKDEFPKGNELVEKTQNYLQVISEVIKKVKDLHSVKLGKLEPKCVEANVDQLIGQIINMFQAISEQKEIRLVHKKNSDAQLITKLDTMLFKNQVLGNLISNSIKFSKRGDKITIESEKICRGIYIRVIDSGSGIAEDKINKIFDFDKSTTALGSESEPGTGLGLPTVKLVIEKMGGQIKAYNNNQFAGATFEIFFPETIAS